jgi:hypothetical protein
MTNILATRTRVTFEYAVDGYDAKTTQGVIRDGSTEELARIEVLGLSRTKTIHLPWSAVTKVEYRCFTTETVDGVFVITEVEPKNSHPMNWMGFNECSRDSAWARAGARGLETVFVGRDGSRKELGQIFSPRAFERAAYQGSTSYEYSMTDFHYAPEKFESWVKGFRAHPEQTLSYRNDAEDAVKAALPLYVEALLSLGQ